MKRRTLIALLLAAILICSALPLSALADSAYYATATVNASWLRYRQGPGVDTPSYAQEPRGTRVTITKKSTMGWWYYCTGPHGSGWMYYKYLTNFGNNTGARAGEKFVISNRGLFVYLRSNPAEGNNGIAMIPDGSTVTMVDYGYSWCRIRYDGQTGYVMTCKLKAK